MKQFLAILLMTLVSVTSWAHGEQQTPDEPVQSPLLGEWQTQHAVRVNPYAVAYADVVFSEDKIWLQATCVYNHGPEITATVEAPVVYNRHSFTILEGKREITGDHGFTCEAYLAQGTIHFRERHNRLFLSHPNGWRLSLVRK